MTEEFTLAFDLGHFNLGQICDTFDLGHLGHFLIIWGHVGHLGHVGVFGGHFGHVGHFDRT